MSTDLNRALDSLVPTAVGAGDWHDVLRRAGVRRPRRTLAIAAAVLALFVAAPAFALLLGVIDRKNVNFAKAPPASNRIKKQFSDLSIGAPPRDTIGALAHQARLAGTLHFGGKPRQLWVVPTTRGGYCYLLEGYGGGCKAARTNRGTGALQVGWSFSRPRNGIWTWSATGGVVASSAVQRLEVQLSDGRKVQVPFIWVSQPIGAGFFGYSPPTGLAAKAVAAYDDRGRRLQLVKTPRAALPPLHVPPPGAGQSKPRELPATPTIAPTAPLQRGTANGFSVVVGANGSAAFHAGTLPAATRRFFGGGAMYACFRLTREFGIFDARSYGVWGRFATDVGMRFTGLGRPIDGCEVSGSSGHTWPDRNGSHAPVEIPLTRAGTAFFTDRAAARDLAAFVRTRRVQQIRKEPAAHMRRELESFYGELLRRRSIQYAITAEGVTFRKRSETGKEFRVVVKHGRIARQNLTGYAFVF